MWLKVDSRAISQILALGRWRRQISPNSQRTIGEMRRNDRCRAAGSL